MTRAHGAYEIDDDRERIDLELVHSWLATSYWSPGIAIERVRKTAANSAMVIGAYLNCAETPHPPTPSPRHSSGRGGVQVGYARVVSDKVTFSWIADVFVAPDHRGKGIGKAMVRFALGHPDFTPMKRWVLATRDAHEVYTELGFQPIDKPQNWMILRGEPTPEGSP
ncbi:MAG: GNAT family N-acetyltransferase [Fimbriimonadaceae bacterium]